MYKRLITLVLSLLLLILVSTTTASAAIPNNALSYNVNPEFNTATVIYGPPIPRPLLYGPPIPKILPTLASRGGADLLQTYSAPPQPQSVAYKIQAGDTLSSIANVFNTDVKTLVQMNNIADPGMLQIGQQIKIPNLDTTLAANYVIKNVMSFNLTAYTAGFESTGKNPGDPDYGVTATGAHVKDGETIAVDPSVIPLGTKVYIEGIGVRIAEDTGGAIIGNRIDVYMNDLTTALNFGYKRNIKVYILGDKPKSSDASSNVASNTSTDSSPNVASNTATDASSTSSVTASA